MIAAYHGGADGLYRKQLVGKGAFGVNIILFEESEVDTPFKREDPRVVHLLEVLRRKPGDVTCLLYTSPSPRDKRQSRMPSSA